jgi:uncharacterized protein (TIGR02284 family)
MGTYTDRDRTEDVEHSLREITQLNLDSRDGFQEAADEVDDPNLRRLFEGLARERGDQAAELQALVASEGGEPVVEGSFLAAMHRTWMQIRKAIVSNDTHAILAEAERGEDHIKEAYEDMLPRTTDSRLMPVLDRQYRQVVAAHDRIRNLLESTKAN